MHARILGPLFAVMAFVFLASQFATAAEKSHDGMVVSANAGKLTMTNAGDEKKHSHNVAASTKIMVDGKSAKLDDLKPGFHVTVTTDDKNVVTKIEGHSKAK